MCFDLYIFCFLFGTICSTVQLYRIPLSFLRSQCTVKQTHHPSPLLAALLLIFAQYIYFCSSNVRCCCFFLFACCLYTRLFTHLLRVVAVAVAVCCCCCCCCCRCCWRWRWRFHASPFGGYSASGCANIRSVVVRRWIQTRRYRVERSDTQNGKQNEPKERTRRKKKTRACVLLPTSIVHRVYETNRDILREKEGASTAKCNYRSNEEIIIVLRKLFWFLLREINKNAKCRALIETNWTLVIAAHRDNFLCPLSCDKARCLSFSHDRASGMPRCRPLTPSAAWLTCDSNIDSLWILVSGAWQRLLSALRFYFYFVLSSCYFKKVLCIFFFRRKISLKLACT